MEHLTKTIGTGLRERNRHVVFGLQNKIPQCIAAILVITLQSAAFCGDSHSLEVTATAYNSLANQTQGDPRLTAWGDKLVPGMKAIAVSRDLIDMGLTHGVKVTIDGMSGTFIVRDKLNKRWKRRIDIYMGNDVSAAKAWGKRKVTIRW